MQALGTPVITFLVMVGDITTAIVCWLIQLLMGPRFGALDKDQSEKEIEEAVQFLHDTGISQVNYLRCCYFGLSLSNGACKCFFLFAIVIPTFAYAISKTIIDSDKLIPALHREGIQLLF
jgi:uncharacterized membrane protein YagU involved in acid resistance